MQPANGRANKKYNYKDGFLIMTNNDKAMRDEETAGQFLQRLGMDGKLWAEDDLLGWCCNMIMAGYDEAERRARAATQAPKQAKKIIKSERSGEEKEAIVSAFNALNAAYTYLELGTDELTELMQLEQRIDLAIQKIGNACLFGCGN